ncbi:MAG: phage holin family protein [Vicingaceae bacterium]
MKWIAKLFANALAVIITAYLLPGVSVEDFLTALLVAVVLALLNSFLKPILIILTIPVTILTFGLFLLVINAVIILLADDLIDAFHVNSFWWALLFSLVMSFFTSLFNRLDRENKSPNQHIDR